MHKLDPKGSMGPRAIKNHKKRLLNFRFYILKPFVGPPIEAYLETFVENSCKTPLRGHPASTDCGNCDVFHILLN